MLIIYVKHKVTLFSFSYADVKSIIFPMLMFLSSLNALLHSSHHQKGKRMNAATSQRACDTMIATKCFGISR